MSERMRSSVDGLAKLFNPESLRFNLVSVSLFLAAWEILCDAVIDRIRSFFARELDNKFEPIDSERYRELVLSLDRSRLRASILWLKNNAVIDDEDVKTMEVLREQRNKLAHELPKVVSDPDVEIDFGLFDVIFRLVTKIERWWILEVEIPINPNFDGRKIAPESVRSGRMLFLEMITQIAIGKDSDAYWNEFQRQRGQSSKNVSEQN
jgi:hypothetical protein